MKKKAKILVADDEERIRIVLSDILVAQGYKVIQAQDGAEALDRVMKDSPDVILLDIAMPEIDGIEIVKKLKSNEETQVIPVVIVTGSDDTDLRIEALKLGADDFLVKPPHVAELTARIRSLVKVKEYNDHMRNYQKKLEEEVSERTKQLMEAHEKLRNASLDTIYRLSRAAEFKDEDTSVHLQRISNYTAAIARKLGADDSKAETLLYAAPMHDIGKIGIPDRILLKPGKLDADEWQIMKQHTTFGGQILTESGSDFLNMGKSIALTHHERWDGSGYPKGLKKEEIPIEGRITAIADVFDALVSNRPYKKAFPLNKSLKIIRESSGTHFDPAVVDTFFAIKDEILEIKEKYQDSGASILFQLANDKMERMPKEKGF